MDFRGANACAHNSITIVKKVYNAWHLTQILLIMYFEKRDQVASLIGPGMANTVYFKLDSWFLAIISWPEL